MLIKVSLCAPGLAKDAVPAWLSGEHPFIEVGVEVRKRPTVEEPGYPLLD